ncbi:MAG: hypothetical protein R2856_35380 [Caldilineaceae bacterium]
MDSATIIMIVLAVVLMTVAYQRWQRSLVCRVEEGWTHAVGHFAAAAGGLRVAGLAESLIRAS